MNRFPDVQSKLVDKVVVLPVRFNMLHRGHEAYINAVLRCQPRAVYIFLGRSNAFRIETDPFDDVERRCMIASFAATLAPSDAERLHLFPIFNRMAGAIDWSPAKVSAWYGHCADLLRARGLPHWDVVVSGNKYTDGYSGDIVFVSPYELVRSDEQVYIDNDVPVFATRVRQLFYARDGSWPNYVSAQTARIMRDRIEAFPMSIGPMEGIRHLVRIQGSTLDAQPFCLTRVVGDGEFKDHVAVDALNAHLNRNGTSAHLQACNSDPYFIAGRVTREADQFDARLSLRSVVPSNGSDALEYQFEFSVAPVELGEATQELHP